MGRGVEAKRIIGRCFTLWLKIANNRVPAGRIDNHSSLRIPFVGYCLNLRKDLAFNGKSTKSCSKRLNGNLILPRLDFIYLLLIRSIVDAKFPAKVTGFNNITR